MTVREEVRQRIEQDPEMIRLRQKIESGKATYADTAAYSNRAGKLLGEVFSRRLPEIPLEEREPLCVELLHDRYIDINAAVDTAQRFMDERMGIQIAPQHAPFNDERAHQIGSATADPTVSEETQQRRSRSATETATKSMHDDRMKAESKFRHRAGLDCRITRVAVNGCCPWCSKVAGRYRYGEEPDDIYRRHDNCDCTVTFENGRKRQDVWSKREWEVPELGAGAGDPVVFTKEQAEKLQAEHGLTNKPNNGTMSMRMAAPLQQPPDFSKYGIKRDLSAVESIKQFMCDVLDIPSENIDLKNIQNTDVLEPFAKRLKKIKDDTGMIFPSIVASDVIDGDLTCIASYKPSERRLYISSRYFNSKEALIDTLKDWASKDIMPKQAKSIAYIAEHEAAHIRIPDSLLDTEEAAKIWKRRKLTNDNDYDIYEYYADITAIFRLNKSTSDSSVLKAIEYLIQGGVSM